MLYGLSLAFVVIPEELPIIITMVLGVGSYALSKKGAIVKRLRAAEALGNVTVIATDKTGTITENKMRLEHFYFDGVVRRSQDFKGNEKAALRTAFLASDAVSNATSSMVLGNPMAQAILERLKQDGVNTQKASEGWVLKDELSFDVITQTCIIYLPIWQLQNCLNPAVHPRNFWLNHQKFFCKVKKHLLMTPT